jgi:hypothetical protein
VTVDVEAKSLALQLKSLAGSLQFLAHRVSSSIQLRFAIEGSSKENTDKDTADE